MPSSRLTFKIDTVRLGIMVKYGCDLFKKVARDTSLDINVRKKSRRLLAILGVNGELHILFALFFISLYSVLCLTCY